MRAGPRYCVRLYRSTVKTVLKPNAEHNRAGVVLRLLEACNKRRVLQKKATKVRTATMLMGTVLMLLPHSTCRAS